MALPAAGLSAHTAQGISHRPVSATIPNAFFMQKAGVLPAFLIHLHIPASAHCYISFSKNG